MLHPLQTPEHVDNAVTQLRVLLDILQTNPISLRPLAESWDAFREVFGRHNSGEKLVNENDSFDGTGLADGPGLKSLIDRSAVLPIVRRKIKALPPTINAVVGYLRQTKAGDHGIDEKPIDEACEKLTDLISLMVSGNRECRMPKSELAEAFASAVKTIRELIDYAATIRQSWYNQPADQTIVPQVAQKHGRNAPRSLATPIATPSADWQAEHKTRVAQFETWVANEFQGLRAVGAKGLRDPMMPKYLEDVQAAELAVLGINRPRSLMHMDAIEALSACDADTTRARSLIDSLARNYTMFIVHSAVEPGDPAAQGSGRKRGGQPKGKIPPEVKNQIIHCFCKGTKDPKTVHGLVDGPKHGLKIEDVDRTIRSYRRSQQPSRKTGKSARTNQR